MVTNNDKLFKFVSLVVLAYLWVWTSWSFIPTMANNRLRPGDSLNSSWLVSKNGKFSMFFYDDFNNDALHYLGIASKNSSLIWVANPNEPISNISSVVLTLDHSGKLKITRQGRELIIVYSPSQAINNTVATLQDDGNFVLHELRPNGSRKSLLWQSFDYPFSCLLPGMQLGVNHKTGHSRSLTSSLSNEAFPFKLEWDPQVGELIIRKGERVDWKSGVLKKNKRFENIQDEAQTGYEYTIDSNENEGYFSFQYTPNDDGVWNLDYNGDLSDGNGNILAKVSGCYGYNINGGCQRWKVPSCRRKRDAFVPSIGYFNDSRSDEDTNTSLGLSDCREICWNKCGNQDCVGYNSFYDNDTGCLFFYRNSSTRFIPTEYPQTYFVLNSFLEERKGTKRWWLWFSAAAVGALSISCAVIFTCLVRKRRKAQKKTSTDAVLDLVTFYGSEDANELSKEKNNGHDINLFSYATILEATDNFSSENKLGEGGFGPVYKGKLNIGKEVAIKRLSRSSRQGSIEFKNELTLISELQHMNLVQLLGCCVQGEENILIYEYMPNKSLDYFLFDSSRSKILDWKTRFNIIEGISQGLLYLHKYSRLKIIHRDLKVSNVLLDENMNPKISDFGLARIFTQEAGGNTSRIVGTYGYMSPEYAMEGIFSIKSDVYSFGILMLETVSGRRNNSFYDPNCPLNLVGYAWDLWKDGVGLEMLDPSVNDSFIPEQVLKCIHVSLLCTQERSVDRPSMSDVLQMLTNENAVLPLPNKPAFYFRRTSNVTTESLEKSDAISRSDLSISDSQTR